MHKTIYQQDPDGPLHYRFHRGQWQAWKSQARFVCVLSGTQGGKTSFGPPWLYQEIRDRGPGDYLVTAPTPQAVESIVKSGRFA